ncbi:MAG: AraC family transcriptional regulator [Burkholderiaceae bacterium]
MPQRLDRLAALLDGLAPEVTLAEIGPGPVDHGNDPSRPPGLLLVLLCAGSLTLRRADAAAQVRAPALLVLRSDLPCVLAEITERDHERVISLRARLTGPGSPLFLDEFSEPRIVSLDDDEPALRLAVDMLKAELDAPRCGHAALLSRAGDILFIGLLRHLVANPGPHGSGLFSGLADPRIARALVAMHQRPDLNWSLERLSQEAGMSRTAFTSTFREVMKRTPGKYLTAIRLSIARRSVELGKGLKEAARAAGYRNPSALSRALARARQH